MGQCTEGQRARGVSMHSKRRSAQEAGVEEEEREIGSSGGRVVGSFDALVKDDPTAYDRAHRRDNSGDIGRRHPGRHAGQLFARRDRDEFAAAGARGRFLATAAGRLRHARPHGTEVPDRCLQKRPCDQDEQDEQRLNSFHCLLHAQFEPLNPSRRALSPGI